MKWDDTAGSILCSIKKKKKKENGYVERKNDKKKEMW